MCAGMRRCERVCVVVCRSAQCAQLCVGMCGVQECAQVCVGYLLETRVLTSADFNMYPVQIFYYIHTEFPSKMAKKLFPIQFKMFQEGSGFRIHIQSITISVLLARESLSRQSYEFHDLFLKL